ncbi:MAG: GAF domain-containing protein [Candidatus Niyogibacteria bacterium]|nr:GAF domain-containing protein [Candidatus Niyogibacteria bacterium]
MAVSKSKKRVVRNQAEWFRILNLLSRTINLASTDLAGILKNLTRGLIREIGIDAVAVWVAEESGFMKIEASAGLSDNYVRFFNRTDRIPVGKGLVGRIMKGRKTIFFERFEEYRRIGVSRWNQMLEEEGVSAVLAAPMFVGKKVVGTFNIYYKRSPHHFSDGERQFIEILANQIAITIENVSNYRVIEHDKKEMQSHIEKLVDLQRAVGLINLVIYESLERAAEYIAAYVAEKFGGRAVAIFQPDEQGALTFAASFGVSEAYHARFYERAPAGTLMDQAYRDRKVQTSSRILTDPRVEKQWSTFLSVEGFIATAALPLVVRERAIGVLAIHYPELHAFSEDEMSALETIAQFVAASLENIRNIQSLVAEKEKTKAMVYSLHDGLIVYDTAGVIIELNPRVEELLWVAKGDIVGRHPQELAPHQTIMANIREISTILLADFESKELDVGEPLNLTLRISQVPLRDEKNRKIGSIRVVNDITEARAVEKLKSNFVATASHQMRTPLTGIKWGLDTLLKGMGELTRDQRNLIEQVMESNEYVIQLINDLLDVSRMEEGRFEYEFAKSDIAALLDRIAQDFKGAAENSGVAFGFRRPPEAAPPVMMDAGKMELALRNIVDNAVKYTPSGGQVEISLDVGAQSVVLQIKDTGIGIPKEDQKFLFNKFFRGKNAVKVKTEGSGLGLYIAKNIIERHNGTVHMESEEGKGTIITIQLPIREEFMPKSRPSGTATR